MLYCNAVAGAAALHAQEAIHCFNQQAVLCMSAGFTDQFARVEERLKHFV